MEGENNGPRAGQGSTVDACCMRLKLLAGTLHSGIGMYVAQHCVIELSLCTGVL